MTEFRKWLPTRGVHGVNHKEWSPLRNKTPIVAETESVLNGAA